MPFVVQALTAPTTFKKTGDGAVEFVAMYGCVLAAVILDYTAGSGGTDREVALEVLDAQGNLVGVAVADVVVVPVTQSLLCFGLGAQVGVAAVDGKIMCVLPTLPLWKGYTLKVSQTGALHDSDDTVIMTVHLMK